MSVETGEDGHDMRKFLGWMDGWMDGWIWMDGWMDGSVAVFSFTWVPQC